MAITNDHDHDYDHGTDHNDEAALNNLLCTDEIECIYMIYSPNHRNHYRNRSRNRNNHHLCSNTTTTNTTTTTTTNGNSNGTANNNNSTASTVVVPVIGMTTTTTTTTAATTPAIGTLAQGHHHAAKTVTDHPYGKHYERFKKYVDEHNGSTNIPGRGCNGYRKEYNDLISWRGSCILDHRSGTLLDERRQLLLKLNFEFDHGEKKNEQEWDHNFSLLSKYKKSNGHCSMKTRYLAEDGEPLGRWLSGQRRFLRNGKMDSKRKRKLEELGVKP